MDAVRQGSDSWEPWLAPEDAAQLAAEGPDRVGSRGVMPEDVAYGTPLPVLLATFPCPGDFMEAAAYAGHTGPIREGVLMTLRASHRYAVAEIDGCVAGAMVDPWGIVGDVQTLRDIAEVAQLLAEDLEARAASIAALDDLRPMSGGQG